MSLGTARSDSFEFNFNHGLESLPLALLLELLGEHGGLGGRRVGAVVGGLASPGEGAIMEGRRVER